MNIPELLCPAGSFDSFAAAVNNGADAVYFGGRDFNARAGAENFSDDQLLEAIEYAHARGSKVNITLNTLYKNSEIDRVLSFAQKMYEAGADAFIVQDIGLFSIIRELMPDIKIHASTQMTVHSLEGAVFLKNKGFDRVVLSRELSIKEVENIAAKAGLEIEVFAHGALCVSYSGQCLMSSFIGGRSGNRGKCAQSCRQFYDFYGKGSKLASGYLLSPRDMMTLNDLEEIVNAGVTTLKIEGRMKSPEYVAVVTRAYRKALDSIRAGNFNVEKDSVKDVTQIFNRGGEFTRGYFYNHAGLDMMSNKTPKSTGTRLGEVVSVSKYAEKDGKRKCLVKISDSVVPGDGVEIWAEKGENTGGYISEKAEAGAIVVVYAGESAEVGNAVYKSFDKELADRAKKLAVNDEKKQKIIGSVVIELGKPMEMGVSLGSVSVVVTGDAPEQASNQPMSEERILAQLSKTGGTPYIIEFENVEIDNNIYVPVSKLNALRRECLDKFYEAYLNSFKREIKGSLPDLKITAAKSENSVEWGGICAQVCYEEQLQAACDAAVGKIYYTMKGYNFEKIEGIINEYSNKTLLYIALPKIMREYEEKDCAALIKKLENTDVKGILVSTYGQFGLAVKLSKKEIVTDYSFNIFNNYAYDYAKKNGAGRITLSAEMGIDEIKNIQGGEVLLYGQLPLMTTAQCPVGLYAGQKKNGRFCKLKNKSAGHELVDKTGAKFPVETDCEGCFAMILNGPVLNMQEKFYEFYGTNVDSFRLLFYKENYSETKAVLKSFKDACEGSSSVFNEPTGNITYGRYFRGVQ